MLEAAHAGLERLPNRFRRPGMGAHIGVLRPRRRDRAPHFLHRGLRLGQPLAPMRNPAGDEDLDVVGSGCQLLTRRLQELVAAVCFRGAEAAAMTARRRDGAASREDAGTLRPAAVDHRSQRDVGAVQFGDGPDRR